MALENNNTSLRERKGKAAVEADHDDDRHHDHHHDLDLDELNEAAHLEAQLALSNLDITLSQLPSTSRQPSLVPDLLKKKRSIDTNSESGSDNDDDILEKVKKKLSKLYVGKEIDVILEWMEEILRGLEEVRKELTTLQKDMRCKPDRAA